MNKWQALCPELHWIDRIVPNGQNADQEPGWLVNSRGMVKQLFTVEQLGTEYYTYDSLLWF